MVDRIDLEAGLLGFLDQIRILQSLEERLAQRIQSIGRNAGTGHEGTFHVDARDQQVDDLPSFVVLDVLRDCRHIGELGDALVVEDQEPRHLLLQLCILEVAGGKGAGQGKAGRVGFSALDRQGHLRVGIAADHLELGAEQDIEDVGQHGAGVIRLVAATITSLLLASSTVLTGWLVRMKQAVT